MYVTVTCSPTKASLLSISVKRNNSPVLATVPDFLTLIRIEAVLYFFLPIDTINSGIVSVPVRFGAIVHVKLFVDVDLPFTQE